MAVISHGVTRINSLEDPVLAGWMNQRQQDVIEYLREENRVLREQLGDRRFREL